MKKIYIIIFLIVIITILIFVFTLNNKDKNNDRIIPKSDLVLNESPLLKEDKVLEGITFMNCNIVTVNSKTKLKVELKNNNNKIFTSKRIIFQLLDSNNIIISQETKSNIVIAKDGKLIVNIEFDKAYVNVYDVQFLIE
ncbi:MAG: hypothetical protein K0R72_316 [Clostridia bacterium]|jgi:hypothetical protein|nr:hypothetical protein [Clostridia bacterium]